VEFAPLIDVCAESVLIPRTRSPSWWTVPKGLFVGASELFCPFAQRLQCGWIAPCNQGNCGVCSSLALRQNPKRRVIPIRALESNGARMMSLPGTSSIWCALPKPRWAFFFCDLKATRKQDPLRWAKFPFVTPRLSLRIRLPHSNKADKRETHCLGRIWESGVFHREISTHSPEEALVKTKSAGFHRQARFCMKHIPRHRTVCRDWISPRSFDTRGNGVVINSSKYQFLQKRHFEDIQNLLESRYFSSHCL